MLMTKLKNKKIKEKMLNEQIDMIKRNKVLSFENRKENNCGDTTIKDRRTDKCNEIIVELKDVSLTSDQRKI